jgi:precorrin-6A/cobalt-precorrin-6A reductase
MTTVILGGTAEARQLAADLVADGIDVVSSLAGRVRHPRLPAGRVRIGGFGGADGLATYLRDQQASALVDATHPFAATITTNALGATRRTGIPLVRLERLSWSDHPHASSWTWVADAAAARAAAESARRPFLTTGRQSLNDFAAWADRHVLVRLVDPPASSLPQRWTVITSRGPYSYAGERRLLDEYAVGVLLAKDSGGTHTVAKLDAADDLDIPVVIIARPDQPPVPLVTTVAEAMAWCRSIESFGDASASRGSRL